MADTSAGKPPSQSQSPYPGMGTGYQNPFGGQSYPGGPLSPQGQPSYNMWGQVAQPPGAAQDPQSQQAAQLSGGPSGPAGSPQQGGQGQSGQPGQSQFGPMPGGNLFQPMTQPSYQPPGFGQSQPGQPQPITAPTQPSQQPLQRLISTLRG